jgi:hypothetical protein
MNDTYYDYQVDPDERGSKEHATKSLLRNYHHDLTKITDTHMLRAAIDAFVARVDACDKETEPIDKDYVPRFRGLQERFEALPPNDAQRPILKKEIDETEREWDRRRAPAYNALHQDLDKIVGDAVAPYTERQRELVKRADAAGKSLTARELADQLKERQKQHAQERQPSNDQDRER